MPRLLEYWELPIVIGINEYDYYWLIKEESDNSLLIKEENE